MGRLRDSWTLGASRLKRGIADIFRSEDLILTILAIMVGAAAAYGAIGFRWFIDVAQTVFYGAGEDRMVTIASALPWWQILLAPTVGGLMIGLLIRYVMPGHRPLAIADVIEAADRGGGKISLTQGLWAGFINAASIGTGASVGREGPVVHLGASIASWIARRLRLSQGMGIYLLGCGVAAAVAASFNAPLAGALFAHEVIIRHYRLRAFAPVVLASVTGTLISRAQYGDFPAFVKPEYEIVSIWEFPAFALLGVVSGIIAILMVEAVKRTQFAADRLRAPVWLRPAAAGLIVGAIAIELPQILGVGYEATDQVLQGSYGLWLLLAVAAAKIVATGLSLGSGFGGGIFSPSLVVGAFAGAAFGTIAALVFPELASTRGAYSLIAMGAVAAAVLGAPISTILIIFELTGDYAVTVAVMVAVVLANIVMTQLGHKSFFHWQLGLRGARVDEDKATRALREATVRRLMDDRVATVPQGTGFKTLRARLNNAPHGELYVTGKGGALVGALTFADVYGPTDDPDKRKGMTAGELARRDVPALWASDTLEKAVLTFSERLESHLPVLNNREERQVIGVLHHRDVLVALDRARHLAIEGEEAAAER